MSDADIRLQCVAGEHLRQDWIPVCASPVCLEIRKPLSSLGVQLLLERANASPNEALISLVNIVESLKQRIMFTR